MSDFWSKRRAAVEAEQEAEAVEAQVALRAEAEAEVAEKTDDELLAEFDLPVPETLVEGDDFKPFLSDAIPARLRTRALRALWRVNPVFANLDGLVDYGEDFTDAAMVVENMQSTYQVGKGMKAHIEEMARQEEAKRLAEAEAEGASEDEADVEAEEEPALDVEAEEPVEAASELTSELEPEPEMEEVDMAIAPRRRMQFTFEEHQTG